jgi:hypothetical protein
LAMLAAVLGLMAPPPARAQAWTCTGPGAALCALQLSLGNCPAADQVCVGSDALSSTGSSTGCVCLPSCTTSAGCGSGEACILQLGGHCTSRFACNADRDCPTDARCTLGACSKVSSCAISADCPSALPDCVRGACTLLTGPDRCTSNAECGGDPCAGPRACDLATNRCALTAPRPCDGMPGAQCVASGGRATCMIPACTSDTQCSTDPCAGTPQRCNARTGRCEPGDRPCTDGSSFCMRVANAPGLAYCAPIRADPLDGITPAIERFDPDDFEIVWTTDPPVRGLGGHGYTLRAWLPAAALREGGRPGNLRVVVAAADRGLLVDGSLAPPGKAAKWVRDAKGDVWRWKRESSSSPIDSVTLAPVAAQGGRVRVEVRGRTIAGAPAVDAAKPAHAAKLLIDWAGAKPYSSETSVAIDACRAQGEGRRSTVVCAGRPAPAK